MRGLDRLLLDQRAALGEAIAALRWPFSGYSVPAPRGVKIGVLKRYGYLSGSWIESGTYLGRTTRILARKAESVITIEPSKFLAERAMSKLQSLSNVRVIHALSEDVFPSLLAESSSPLSLWLDGHTSGGLTHLGPIPTPIRSELSAIASLCGSIDRLAVFIDDFRGFGNSHEAVGAYPHRSELVSWANALQLGWTIEHDIFVARR